MKFHVYVDIKGEDGLHAEFLADTVSATVRGMGLALRQREDIENGRWPGCCDRFRVTEHGEVIRLSSAWRDERTAKKVAGLTAEWFLANAWNEYLVAVFYVQHNLGNDDRKVAVHGEPLSFLEIAHKYDSLTHVLSRDEG